MKQKSGYRDRFRRYRQTLTSDLASDISTAIQDRIVSLPVWDSVESALLYLPQIGSNEVDLGFLIESLKSRDVQIVLPVVAHFGKNAQSPRITARALGEEDDLVANRWGIPEPVRGPLIEVGSLDVVVVPALGAGRNLFRIGHGYGYYDELLSGARCPKICPVPAGCLVDYVPFEDHDVPVDYIVTEVETIGASEAL